MLRRGGGVQGVAVQPLALARDEQLERLGLVARVARLEARKCLVQRFARHRVRVSVRGALEGACGAAGDRLAQRRRWEKTGRLERRQRERQRAAREDARVVRRLVVLGRLSLRAELHGVEPEVRSEAQEGEPAFGQRRPASHVVARIARQRRVVHGQRQPADAERLERRADELALGGHAGASHTTPSGGSVNTADAGWPSCATGSACTLPELPTPDPPYSAASVLITSRYSPARGRPRR